MIARSSATSAIKLALVDDTAAATKLYRAHVDPARRDAVLRAARRPARGRDRRAGLRRCSSSPFDFLPPAVDHHAEPEPRRLSPTTRSTSTSGTCDQIGMPKAWKLGRRQRRDRRGARHRRRLRELQELPPAARPRRASRSSTRTTSSPTTPTPTTTTATARTSPARSRRSTNNGIGVAGVARNVQIMPLKVLSGSGSGSVGRHRRRDPLRRRSRRQGHQHEPRRRVPVGGAQEGGRVRARQGRHRGVRRRQREPRQGRLSGRVPGRDRGQRDPVRRGDHVLLELRQGHRHRGAGRQHPGRPERRRHARRRPAEHHRDRRSDQGRLLRLHGHVDGVAARRRRRRAGRRRGRDRSRSGRDRSSRTARASRRRATPSRSTAPASSTRRPRCSRRGRRPAATSSGSAC